MNNRFSLMLHWFLEWLSSTPKVGALHLQGTTFAYLRLDGATEAFSVKVEPGSVQGGKIVDRARVLAALVELRTHVGGGAGKKEEARVVVVMPSEPVYTQGVSIPNVGKERLEESASLNLQMVSPVGQGGAYMHYELLEEIEDHYELLAAFIEKRVVDEFRAVLEEAGFSPIIFEFSSLSLARLMERTLGPRDYATLGFYLSSDGLEFFIVKKGKLHFSYFHSWTSIQGNAREISRELFDEVVTREVQKVVNFSLGKFKERPREVVLVAQGLEEEMKTLLTSRFELPVVTLEVGGGFTPPWYVVLGAALRGKSDLGRDTSINLASLSSGERLFQEQTLGFVKLWRNMVGGVLILFLLFFGGSAYFLSRTARNVALQLAEFTARFNASELSELTTRADEFNALVASISAVADARVPWHTMLRTLEKVMRGEQVTLDRIEVSGKGGGVTLIARAPSNDRLLTFKNTLAGTPGFTNVNLVVAQITTLEDNSVGFTVTFTPVFP
ncbi:MAG: PilN domain-containing protein, partial [Candidatus Jorgensenbacteria bacterium]|nr:PilN domain-containing protein [Candidatus Jorgensenbacteria bacterium]